MHENDDDYAFHYFGPTVTTNAGLPAVALFGGKTIFNCCGTTNPNLRNLWSSVDPINKRHGIGATTIVDWSPDNFDLKSITAYRNFTRFNQDDLAVSDAVLYGKNLYDESSESYSQDFTVSTKAAGILWLGGVSFFHERLFGSVKVPTIGLGVTLTGGNCRPRVASAALPCNFEDAGNYWQLGTVTTNAYGVFVQGTYSFTDKLELTAGLRFSHEARSGNGSFIFDALGVDVPTDQSASWNAVTPKLLLEYHPDADTLIYASVQCRQSKPRNQSRVRLRLRNRIQGKGAGRQSPVHCGGLLLRLQESAGRIRQRPKRGRNRQCRRGPQLRHRDRADRKGYSQAAIEFGGHVSEREIHLVHHG
jgi:iron complex outermembrane receptor protein